ncbi:hypothetical protein D778_00927 [Xanthomarina gelatinilytica]|uniref:Fibronectin type-III domain-containing protein n=1 Tax=Xanthomarina gelatinilytica TaxID=1137281 RepID=M7MDI0_9FLAO|nr:GEVED domain-containing protein [Xanthomarina gelatinilytica]EMQ94212.1 hypothetical protein D778_00927 [Xanthomarina gelatinilytica]
MKKITFLLVAMLAFCWQGHAQVLTEGFESGAIPTGWSLEYVSGTFDWTYVAQNGNASITPRTGAYMAEFRNGTSGSATKLVTSALDLTTLSNPQLTFYYANVNWFGDIDELRVYYKSSAGGTWTQIGIDYTAEQTAWTEVKLILPNPSNDYYIAFEGTSNWARGLNLDDVLVDEGPTCLPPSAITATTVTATTADLEWTAGASGETAWNLEWKAGADFTPGNGEADGTDAVTDGTPDYNAINLTPNTTYYVHYQADCGGGDTSAWAGAFVFTTECVAYTPDYTADMSTNAPDCWKEADNGDPTTGPTELGSGLWYASNHNGTPSNAINIWSDYKSDWLISPIIDLSSAAPSELKVYVALTEGGTSGSGADLGSDDEVALLMTTDGGATWTTMQSWTQGNVPTDVGEEITYDLTAQTGQVQFAFWGSEGTVDDSEDVYFHVSTFVVREIPACSDVSDITIDGLTGTSVDFSWTQEDGSTTDWEYVVQTADLDTPTGSGTAVSGTPSAQDATLMADTFYEIYVRSYCGGSDYGAWIGPIEFFTGPCVPSGTSALSYIDVFTTSGAAGTNIDNSSSGFATDNYGNYFSTHYVELASDQNFDFSVGIVGGTVGAAIWIDWNNDFVFDLSEVVYSTTGYGSGPFTGTITVPNGTANGDYRMRVLIDYYDSNPGDDDACSFGSSGRGEAEDYKITVDNSLSVANLEISQFTYFPNPVNNTLSLRGVKDIQNVAVYNMLGQEVLRTAPNSVNSDVDMSGLQSGTYFVKVMIENTTKTIKVVKK